MSRRRSAQRSSGPNLALREETLVESVPRDLDLTLDDARALAAVGRSLSLNSDSAPSEETADGDEEPTLVACVMNPSGSWRVTVRDAIGLIAVGELRILVEPKIPRAHLFHLFARAQVLPRLAPSEAGAAAG